MSFTSKQLEQLADNSWNVSNAISLANQITADPTLGGVFPNGDKGDFSKPDTAKFNEKWCKWWKVAKVLLELAKTFTNDKIDKVIDATILLGDSVCNPKAAA